MLKETSKLLKDRVLVKPTNPEEKTSGGIILVNTAQKRNTGKVILIGVKTKAIKEGDSVLYHEGAGISISYNGMDCLLLSEEHEIISIL